MAGQRIFAIGDIHGCPVELNVLLDYLAPTSSDTVCFLGDYVDRGPDARGVIETLIDFAKGPSRNIFLRGNHEDMLLDFAGREGHFGDVYLENGGAVTLRSYGLAPVAEPQLYRRLPAAHLAFLEGLELVSELGRCLSVHAGLRPGVALDQQRPEDLMWIREDFFNHPHDFGRPVLFGHTPIRTVKVEMPYLIGLDTGLVYGGRLSCLELSSGLLYQVARRSHQVATSDLTPRLGNVRLADPAS